MPMTKAIKISKGVEQGVKDFLRSLLENGNVAGVFTLKKINDEGAVAYSLITSPDEVKDAVPFFPLMPVNAGNLLSRFTLKDRTKDPVIAVVKPCEVRGFVELVKREQGSFENLSILSYTCGGAFPISMAVDQTVQKHLSSYWDAVKNGEILSDLRPVCKSCDEFLPYNADFTVDLIGNSDIEKQCTILINTKKGEDVSKGFKGQFIEKKLDEKKLDTFRKKREKEKEILFDDLDHKMNGMDGLIDIFGKCIGCHGCMRVCPICYCTLCEFESPDVEYRPSTVESEIAKRGGMRVPPGTIYYHLGRLTHISISCVACGACDDVCPVDIPVAGIFKKVGESVQKMFEYVPGKDIDEDIPLVAYKKEEFSDVED
jgi:formate dehydrogenase subunit beta